MLSYPNGYYTGTNPPAGKKAVGIEFTGNSQISIGQPKFDYTAKTVTYDFTFRGNFLTMTVVGDKDDSQLTFGLTTGDSHMQYQESGEDYFRVTTPDGKYDPGTDPNNPNPWFGVGGWDETTQSTITESKVMKGTSKQVKVADPINETMKDQTIATGTIAKGQDIEIEYLMDRYKPSAKYWFWPSTFITYNYYPTGADYSTSIPLSQSLQIWQSDWTDGSDGNPPTTVSYDLPNGVKATVTVEQIMPRINDLFGNVVGYRYRAKIKISNVQDSFYLSSSADSSVQGTHFIRNFSHISNKTYMGSSGAEMFDSNIAYSPDDSGGNIKQTSFISGTKFLDKQAILNSSYAPGTGMPGASANDKFFKFELTPQWGYVNPVIKNYDGNTYVDSNYIAEAKSGATIDNINLGNYSWFNESFLNRTDISPFQYDIFMPQGSGNYVRATDAEAVKVTAEVANNTADGANNPYVTSTSLDLLEHDTVQFNKDYVPKPPGTNYTFLGFYVGVTAADGNNPILPAGYERKLYKDLAGTVYFQPGDTVSISDYYRGDAALLMSQYKKNGTLTKEEKERLVLLMFTSKFKVTIYPVYRQGTSTEGSLLTGYVNKYLQNMDDSGLSYLTNKVDSQSVSIIGGSNISFTGFVNEYLNPTDGYTYYLNKKNTTFFSGILSEDKLELASTKYDRGMTVTYDLGAGGAIIDSNIYRTYADAGAGVKSTANIVFPTAALSPPGKLFDHWTVEELKDDNSGTWQTIPGLEIRPDENGTAQYLFSSGTGGHDKSIKLTAVWRDILPDDYISIPKQVRLYEDGSNLTPSDEYAGGKATIKYSSVNGAVNDKNIAVDVLKNFDLSLTMDTSYKLNVKSYNQAGQPLTTPGINQNYARAGVLNTTSPVQTIYFNTKSQDAGRIFQSNFTIDTAGATGPGSGPSSNALFYIYSTS